jgi:hypothetical protein
MEIDVLLSLFKAILEEDDELAKIQLQDIFEETGLKPVEKVTVYWLDGEYLYCRVKGKLIKRMPNRDYLLYGYHQKDFSCRAFAEKFIEGLLSGYPSPNESDQFFIIATIGWDAYIDYLVRLSGISPTSAVFLKREGPPPNG